MKPDLICCRICLSSRRVHAATTGVFAQVISDLFGQFDTIIYRGIISVGGGVKSGINTVIHIYRINHLAKMGELH